MKKSLFLVKRKSGNYPKHKGIKYYGEHSETKPGKNLKELFCDEISEINKGIPVNVFNK